MPRLAKYFAALAGVAAGDSDGKWGYPERWMRTGDGGIT